MNLYLIGFMASGKSTLGRFLSEYTGRSFRDLDRLIEERAGRSIREIFAGESQVARRADRSRWSLRHQPPGDGTAGEQLTAGLRYRSGGSDIDLDRIAAVVENGQVTSAETLDIDPRLA